jgi:hypothetical protein
MAEHGFNISVGVLGQVSIASHSYRPIKDQISILIVGCVTTWSQGSHKLVSELGSEKGYILMLFLLFFSVPLSFSVFASFIFMFFVSASSKQKKRDYISSYYYL